MIPQYPFFKKLELSDKTEVEKLTLIYPPYSDFNFVSLYSYNVNDTAEISILNGNLVIKFEDYITNQPFYSYIGINDPGKTVNTLLQRAKLEAIENRLQLIPEINIKELEKELNPEFKITENMDNFDYIISLESLSNLKGNKLFKKKRLIRMFWSEYPDAEMRILNANEVETEKDVLDMFERWAVQKQKTKDESETEYKALSRVFETKDVTSLSIIGVYIHNKMVGFSICEPVQNSYVMGHFGKADTDYVGIYQYLEHVHAKIFLKEGYTFLNYEQDLGIPNLRISKKAWHPDHYLKKYIIERIR